jgi:thiol-disulfide isomerase/thioredoxin
MRSRVILIALILGLSTLPASQAGEPEDLDEVGFVFGGVHIESSMSGNSTSNLSDLPAIVEDYTATWCTNCVKVEHALDDVEETNNMQQYHFHRFIGENEDPLGSQEGDERWIDRYEQRLPPTVVFNGTLRQIGSVPSGDSLQGDYDTNLQNPLNLGQGTSTLGWVAATNNSSAIATWNLVFDTSLIPEDATIKSSIWVVEDLAYFPDGGNQEEYYHESVRGIIELGDSMSGSMEVTLPTAYDGDDLEVHLIHEVVLPEPEDEEPLDEEECMIPEGCEDDDEEESGLPSISLIAALSVIMVAAFTVQRKQQ